MELQMACIWKMAFGWLSYGKRFGTDKKGLGIEKRLGIEKKVGYRKKVGYGTPSMVKTELLMQIHRFDSVMLDALILDADLLMEIY